MKSIIFRKSEIISQAFVRPEVVLDHLSGHLVYIKTHRLKRSCREHEDYYFVDVLQEEYQQFIQDGVVVNIPVYQVHRKMPKKKFKELIDQNPELFL